MLEDTSQSNRFSVLLAEDDKVMADVIRFNLERAGYSVQVARDGLAAWQFLQNERFDAAILDYQMPGISGEEVTRRVRSDLGDGDLPIIFVSARGMELSFERLHEQYQVYKLVFKPFSPRELIQVVNDAIESSTKSVIPVLPTPSFVRNPILNRERVSLSHCE